MKEEINKGSNEGFLNGVNDVLFKESLPVGIREHPFRTSYRTHLCGKVSEVDVDKEVVVVGWVHKVRDHGGIIFIDLRDRSGLLQVVSDPINSPEAHHIAESVRREFVIQVRGKVRLRPEDMINPKIPTGKVEVVIKELIVLNKAETPPIEVNDNIVLKEGVRLKYRYLDLRRPSMQQRIAFRHKVTKAVRDYFDKLGFYEIETPLLVRSTPEGARDFLVPSRIHHGKFYALPQSPQIYKQLLMLSGFDRYFQIAKCLRDEDLRADRQPEFTQIDVEMSFVNREDILSVIEGMLKYVIKRVLNKDVKIPFDRISYDDAIKYYGLDKPDLRFDLRLKNITEVVKKTDFGIFQRAELVKALVVPKDLSRKEITELEDFVRVYKAKGLFWLKLNPENKENGLSGNIAKYVVNVKEELINALDLKQGQTALIIADTPTITNTALGHLRNKIGKDLKLYDPSELRFVWVVDFPMFEWDDEEQRWNAMHHPFTSPKQEHLDILEKEPEKVRAEAYDCVLNGWEVGGGSIRINQPQLQKRIFKVIGLTEEEAKEKFGFLLEAFTYGAPPHGGIALGLDRLVALLLGIPDIREVIVFPKNKAAENPMDGSPAPVRKEQLEELGIKVVDEEEDKGKEKEEGRKEEEKETNEV